MPHTPSRRHASEEGRALSAAFNHSYSYDDTAVAQIAQREAPDSVTSGAETMTRVHNGLHEKRYGDGVHLTTPTCSDAPVLDGEPEPVEKLPARGDTPSEPDDNCEEEDAFPWSTIHNERREMERRVKQMQDSVESLRETVHTAMQTYRPLHAFVNHLHAEKVAATTEEGGAFALPYNISDTIPVMCLKKRVGELQQQAREGAPSPSSASSVELRRATLQLNTVDQLVSLLYASDADSLSKPHIE